MTVAKQRSEQDVDEPSRREPSEFDHDDIYEILRNRRRRFTLHYLKNNGARAELGDLSEQIAAWENDRSLDQVRADERKRVYTSLQQFHLPKMRERRIVEYDVRAGEIELRPEAEAVDIYLEVVRGNEPSWSQFYLGLAVLNTGLIIAASAGVQPVSALGGTMLAIFTVASFLFSAVVHAYFGRTEMHLGSRQVPPEVDP